MEQWIENNDINDSKAFLDFANALVMHYGEGAGALACEMYDEIAQLEGALVPAAEMVDIPSYGEVAKAINGAKKKSLTMVPDTVGRLVKQMGADTTLQNAKRDRAQFAWIPAGDTCAFCLTLASRGWQYMSDAALKGGHAEHIHANCDCQYAIRFNSSTNVAGYDPDKYLEMYNNAEGNSASAKINSMRRALNAQNGGNNERIRIPQFPASMISAKVDSGEIMLKLSKQQYDKHSEGTKDYERYKQSRIKKGLSEQSKLSISQDDAQTIIENYSGHGIIKARKDGTPMNIEQITCDRIIGEYMQKGQWVETNKAAIHYSKTGAHLVPIKGSHYD